MTLSRESQGEAPKDIVEMPRESARRSRPVRMDVRGKGLNEEQGLYSPPSYGQMIRRPCLRIARVAVSFALLITITASCTHTEDEGKPPAAKGVAIGPLMRSPGSSLLDVDGTDGSDIWAVGEVHAPNPNRERSLIEHWDGSSWGIVPAQDAGRLTSVSAIAADDAWALGDKALLHWDGATWSEVQLPVRKGAYFGSLSASGPDDVWIAGTRPARSSAGTRADCRRSSRASTERAGT
jgi:hypothetical protein